jgi:ATP-dependent Lon protease
VADLDTLSAKEAENGSRTEREIPADAIAIVPVRQLVLFPGMVIPVTLGRPRSIAAAQDAVRAERQIGVLTQRDGTVDERGEIDLYRIGTVANVVRYLTGKDGSHHVVSQGEQRFRVVEFLPGWPFLVARIERIETQDSDSPQIQARFINLKRQALEALELLPQVPQELIQQINAINDAGALADIVAAYLDLTIEQKQEVLETIDLTARIDRVSRFLVSRSGVGPEEVLVDAASFGSVRRQSELDVLGCLVGNRHVK